MASSKWMNVRTDCVGVMSWSWASRHARTPSSPSKYRTFGLSSTALKSAMNCGKADESRDFRSSTA